MSGKQEINGILLAHKPQGLTSNAFLQQVKRLFQARKAGHTGSLDPLATGMLPICFGEATKFSQYLLDADKHYTATGLLGIKTNTGDALGEVTEQRDSFDISHARLLEVLNSFTGKIKQVPSMFSALKHQGQPLYKLAREGKTIEREAREITIHRLDLKSFSENRFSIEVICSKGTYIRNLVEDIGDALGVGAHVVQLHRVNTAGFENETMYTLEELAEKGPVEQLNCLLPMEKVVDHFPSFRLKDSEVLALSQGKTLAEFSFNENPGLFRLYDKSDSFIGLAELNETGCLAVKRLLAIRRDERS